MRVVPPRHWFQFKLSTWFVLVAILAWAMIQWPSVMKGYRDQQRRKEMIEFISNPNSAMVSWGTREEGELYWELLGITGRREA